MIATSGSSVFLFKDSDSAVDPADRILNIGPLWDFDRAAGNVDYEGARLTEGCWVNTDSDSRRPYPLPNWFNELSRNPAFVDIVIARWKEKRPALETYINSSIDTFSLRLEGPQQRNFQRWQLLQVLTYEEEVQFLRSYLNTRMLWLDKAYASRANFDQLCK